MWCCLHANPPLAVAQGALRVAVAQSQPEPGVSRCGASLQGDLRDVSRPALADGKGLTDLCVHFSMLLFKHVKSYLKSILIHIGVPVN